MSRFKWSAIFALMAVQGMHMQVERRKMRSISPRARYTTRIPHEGEREIARRKRQIEAGTLQVSK